MAMNVALDTGCRTTGMSSFLDKAKTRDQLERIARHTAEVIDLGRDLRDDELCDVIALPDREGELAVVDEQDRAIRSGTQAINRSYP